MKFFYILFILFQLLPALLARDQNRIAYLKFLLSNQMQGQSSAGDRDKNLISDSNYKDTKMETTNYEYSILLER